MVDLEKVLEKARRRLQVPAPATRRYLRERAGLTQSDIAAVVGVSAAEISRWESGDRSPRHGDNLERYLAVLDRLTKEANGERHSV